MFGKGRKRWDRNEYPDNWEELAQECKEQAEYTCEFCGNVHLEEGRNRNGEPYDVRVAAAHRYPNDTRNPDPELLCLCQSCHRKYDNRFRDIIEEGEHQAILHEILIERKYAGSVAEGDGGIERVWCDHPECQGYFLPHEH